MLTITLTSLCFTDEIQYFGVLTSKVSMVIFNDYINALESGEGWTVRFGPYGRAL